MTKIFCVLILIMALNGCATGGSLVKKSVRVNNGDTKQQVLSLFGEPGDRQFKEDDEVWQYCKTDLVGFSGDKYVMIWFYRDKVIGVSTYNNNAEFGLCSSFFKTVNWEDAPDRTIEVRSR